MSNVDLIEVIKSMSNVNKAESTPMELALSKTLLILVQETIKRTILPKRSIKSISLLNNDIFFNEIIDDYKDNLKNQKKIIKIYSNLIKAIAKGIGQESEKKGMLDYLKGKFNRNI